MLVWEYKCYYNLGMKVRVKITKQVSIFLSLLQVHIIIKIATRDAPTASEIRTLLIIVIAGHNKSEIEKQDWEKQLPAYVIVVSMLRSGGGAHFAQIACIAGNVTPCI